MRRSVVSCSRLTVPVLAIALGIGLLALVAALRASPSEAQQGTMHDCPLPGKWSVTIWTGDNGTDPSQAFSSCGEVAMEAAYYLDPETQVWSRWFANKPEVSNLSVVNDMQGLLALASAQVPATPIIGLPNPASVYCVEQGYELRIVDEPDGQVGMCVFPDGTQCEEWSFFEGECGQDWAPEPVIHNCPQAGKWSIAVWEGAYGIDIDQALSSCGEGAIEAAYSLDPETQIWSRWFLGEPEVSNLSSLDSLEGLMALGAANAATPTPTPTATPTATATLAATATPTPTATPYSGG
jgi:putative hemolysin